LEQEKFLQDGIMLVLHATLSSRQAYNLRNISEKRHRTENMIIHQSVTV